MSKQSKPLKKGDITASYLIAAVAMLASIVCWFLPTMEANYYTDSSLLLGNSPSKIIYTFFSYKESLPTEANIINLIFLACSVVSLAIVVLTIIRNKVMSPNKALLFPTISYLLYVVLFFIRYKSAQHKYPLYDAKITVVTVIYFMALVFAFSYSLILVCFAPKLKKQQEAEAAELN